MAWLEPHLCASLVCVDVFGQRKNKYSTTKLFTTKYSRRNDCTWLSRPCGVSVNSYKPFVRYCTNWWLSCNIHVNDPVAVQKVRSLGFSLLNPKFSSFCSTARFNTKISASSLHSILVCSKWSLQKHALLSNIASNFDLFLWNTLCCL